MAVPKEIRDVERPINSIVKQIGDKWAVIKRIGCERRNGKKAFWESFIEHKIWSFAKLSKLIN